MDQRLGNYLEDTHPTANSSSLADLPSELLIQIFSHLDPFTLDNTIGNVCRSWKYIINDNELWKETFKKRFGTVQFASLSRNKSWRNEYILRDQILKKWSKGSSIHKNYFLQNLMLSDLAADFANDKIVVFSEMNGTVNVASLSNGKNAAVIPVLSPSESTVYKLSKSCMVFGRYDGKVYAKLLSSKSYLSDPSEMQGATHGNVVTAIDCVENVSGKDDVVGCISGDGNGVLKLWDLKNSKVMDSIKVSDNGISSICSNYKDLIIVQDSSTITIIYKNLTDGNTTHRLKSMDAEQGNMVVDFGMKQVVITTSRRIIVYSFDPASFGTFKTYTTNEDIYKVAIDSNCNKDIDHKIVGHDGCMFGVVLKSAVLIFNIRLNTLTPMCTIQPFYKNEIPENSQPIRSIAINPMVVLLGTYNGYCYLYNILTGAYIRTASVRIPRRLLPIEYNIPVECIGLNADNYMTNGVIVCGNVVQYFQFGDLNSIEKKKKKQKGGLSDRKFALQRGIKSELEEMDYELEIAQQNTKLINKYNGDKFDEDEELQMALALSQSLNIAPPVEDDPELAHIIELSKQDEAVIDQFEVDADEGSSDRYEDDFERALRISLQDK